MALCNFASDAVEGIRERKLRTMKQKIALILAVCLMLLCGCTDNQPADTTPSTVPTTAPTLAPTEAPTQAPTEEPTQAPTEEPTEPTLPYTNPLTGEGTEVQPLNRPFAVILNNYESAMPLHGASEADILYEALTEGGMTRCMGVYSDLASVQTLGSIRSARKHFVSLAMSYDAIFVHYGKSDIPGSDIGAQQYMNETGWNHMDGTSRGYSYFYENQDRHNGGWPSDACHFLVGQRAIDYAVDNKFALTREQELSYGLNFAEENVLNGEKATTLTAWFNRGGTPGKWNKYTTLNYNSETGLYESYQFGKENVDGNTGEVLSFENVLVLRAKTRDHEGSKLVYVDLEGSGTGYYACNGQLVNINWSRESAYHPFVYTLEDGTPLTLGVGKSYVAIVPHNASFSYE